MALSSPVLPSSPLASHSVVLGVVTSPIHPNSPDLHFSEPRSCPEINHIVSPPPRFLLFSFYPSLWTPPPPPPSSPLCRMVAPPSTMRPGRATFL